MTQSLSQPNSSETSNSGTSENTHTSVTVAAGTSRVACNGGGGALGHPQVWLTLTAQPNGSSTISCPYCSRHFVAPAS